MTEPGRQTPTPAAPAPPATTGARAGGESRVVIDLRGRPERRFRLCGLEFVDLDPDDAPAALCAWARDVQTAAAGRHVHLVNAYTIALAEQDPDLKAVLQQPNAINLMDGTPLAWAARRRGLVAPGRRAARGPTLFAATLAHRDQSPVRHYFLGGAPSTLDQLVDHVATAYPTCEVVGRQSPPFRPLLSAELAEQAAELRRARPHLAWIGLGTPKQDFESARIAATVPTLAVAVGAAFDFEAGSKREAPRWLQGSGFEWIYRLATEPRRLWRRYLFGNVAFLKALRADQ